MNKTLTFYNNNALEFYRDTINLDMEEFYQEFLPLLPRSAHILDAGCGSGRDSLAFLKRGFSVTSIDASEEMVKLATKYTGQEVCLMTFEEMVFDGQFDGIWASASLLHIPKSQMDQVFDKFITALKPGGIWYMSFKAGSSEYIDNLRFFNNYTNEELMSYIKEFISLNLVKIWESKDIRLKRENGYWVNAIVKKGG